MNKPFLLIAGWDYYPIRGTGDWVGCFASYEEAEKMIEKVDGCYIKIPIKKINNDTVDWYEIIDLREWTQ